MRAAFRDLGWWLSDLWHGWIGALCTALAIVAGVFGLVIWGAAVGGDKACRAATADMILPARFSFWGGCQVKTPAEGWIPLANLHVVTPAHEVRQ